MSKSSQLLMLKTGKSRKETMKNFFIKYRKIRTTLTDIITEIKEETNIIKDFKATYSCHISSLKKTSTK